METGTTSDDDDAARVEAMRRAVAVEHFGDPSYADVLTKVTLDGLRR